LIVLNEKLCFGDKTLLEQSVFQPITGSLDLISQYI